MGVGDGAENKSRRTGTERAEGSSRPFISGCVCGARVWRRGRLTRSAAGCWRRTWASSFGGFKVSCAHLAHLSGPGVLPGEPNAGDRGCAAAPQPQAALDLASQGGNGTRTEPDGRTRLRSMPSVHLRLPLSLGNTQHGACRLQVAREVLFLVKTACFRESGGGGRGGGSHVS